MENKLVSLLYRNAFGRALLKLHMAIGMPKLTAVFLRSRFSRHLIGHYIKKHQIDMGACEVQDYRSFAEFFERKKLHVTYEDQGLIAPCDGLLSAYTISENSRFSIKGSSYRVRDLLGDGNLGRQFTGGLCLIFRLTASDFHRYIYFDSGRGEKAAFIEGQLHSVQPIALDSFPVYRLNRRCATLLHTDHFGDAAQIEVGALSVGGIKNHFDAGPFRRGQEKGYFYLSGSTIVLLLQKDRAALDEAYREVLDTDREKRVAIGQRIGQGVNREAEA